MREKLEFPPVDTIFYNPEHDELRLEDKCLDMSDQANEIYVNNLLTWFIKMVTAPQILLLSALKSTSASPRLQECLPHMTKVGMSYTEQFLQNKRATASSMSCTIGCFLRKMLLLVQRNLVTLAAMIFARGGGLVYIQTLRLVILSSLHSIALGSKI